MKAELRSLLEKEPRNILVVLDDVDRLTSAETGELFQLIKVNADFPRLVYLVVCDPAVVEDSLGQLVNGRGAEFLQKIVQVPFHLPQALPWQREQMLRDGVAKLLDAIALNEQIDWMRWEDAYDEAVEHYFETPRQIVRFLDTIELTIGHLATHSPRDFDVVDFLLLEILRINERTLYEEVASQKTELTGMQLFYPPEKRAEYLTSLLSAVPTARREFAERIFRDLFPQFGTTGFRTAHTARVNPVSQYETFDRYFFFGIPETEYSGQELSALLWDRRNTEEFLSHLRKARASGRLSTVMRHLMEDHESLTPEVAESMLLALAEFAPELRPHDQSARAAILNEIQILGYQALSTLPPERRDEMFIDLFRGPHTPVLGILLSPTDTEVEPIVSADALRLATTELQTWLRKAAEDGLLLTARSGEMLLRAWYSIAPKDVEEFLAKVIESPPNAVRLLMVFTSHSIIDVNRPRKRHGQALINMPMLKQLTDFERFTTVIKTIDQNTLAARERAMVTRFLLLCELS